MPLLTSKRTSHLAGFPGLTGTKKFGGGRLFKLSAVVRKRVLFCPHEANLRGKGSGRRRDDQRHPGKA